MGDSPGDAGGAAFARSLSALKERGSSILVVGLAEEDGHVAVCERLLGDSSEPRRRLLVLADGGCGTDPGGDARTHVVERIDPVDEPSTDAGSDDGPPTAVPAGDIEALGDAVEAGLDELETTAGEPDPGELRLCLDSLRPLLVDNDVEAVAAFVERVGDRVTASDGMAHFHMPTDRDDRFATALARPVDAVVEVRATDDGPEHRWHVFDGAVESGWLAL